MGQGKTRQGKMEKGSQGFTLIAALLILVLLSGAAAGLLFMVTNEARMGGNDLESNLAFYGAESGMEELTANLSALYQQYQVPTNTQIQDYGHARVQLALGPNPGHGPQHELLRVHDLPDQWLRRPGQQLEHG